MVHSLTQFIMWQQMAFVIMVVLLGVESYPEYRFRLTEGMSL
jgi:hypothetical protein